MDISPLQEFPPSPTVPDVPLFPNSTPMADSSGHEISFSDQEDMALEDIQPNDPPVNNQSLENSEAFEPSLHNSNDAQSIPSLPLENSAMDINQPQEADSELYSYKPSEAFKPSFNDSNEAVNQQKDASNNQSSLSLPLENSSLDINQLPEDSMSLQLEQSANLHMDDNPQPLSELSSPENFHGFSSVPHCRLGK